MTIDQRRKLIEQLAKESGEAVPEVVKFWKELVRQGVLTLSTGAPDKAILSAAMKASENLLVWSLGKPPEEININGSLDVNSNGVDWSILPEELIFSIAEFLRSHRQPSTH